MINRTSSSFAPLPNISTRAAPSYNNRAEIYTRPHSEAPGVNLLPYPQMGVRGMPVPMLATVLPYPAQNSCGMPMPMRTAALPYPENGMGGMPVRSQPYPLQSAQGMPAAPHGVLPLPGFQSSSVLPGSRFPEQATWL